jgi:hypothetical protein
MSDILRRQSNTGMPTLKLQFGVEGGKLVSGWASVFRIFDI